MNLVIRHDDLYRDMSRCNCEVSELVGAATLVSVLVRDLRSGEERLLETTALFVLIASTPHTTWLQSQIPLDEKGFVRTGSARQAGPGTYETGRPGSSPSGMYAAAR